MGEDKNKGSVDRIEKANVRLAITKPSVSATPTSALPKPPAATPQQQPTSTTASND